MAPLRMLVEHLEAQVSQLQSDKGELQERTAPIPPGPLQSLDPSPDPTSIQDELEQVRAASAQARSSPGASLQSAEASSMRRRRPQPNACTASAKRDARFGLRPGFALRPSFALWPLGAFDALRTPQAAGCSNPLALLIDNGNVPNGDR